MKRAILIISRFVLLVAMFIPISILAQQKEVHVSIKSNEESDNKSKNTAFWSISFEVDDIAEMHKKLDSIFAVLDDDLDKRIKVMAFDKDSLTNDFNFVYDFDFSGNIDSIITMFKLSANDKRIQTLIKSHKGHGKNKYIIEEDDFNQIHHLHEGMNIEVITDSVMRNGKKVITKEVIISSHDSLGIGQAPVIIKKYRDDDGVDKEVVVAYVHKEGYRYPDKHIKIKRGGNKIKSGEIVGSKKHISSISISDAELLVKGGVSSKIITSPPLNPEKVGVNIKVENWFGNEFKNIGLSVDFKDTAPIHVLVLDKDGNKVFEEKQKSFTGTYTHNIELNEAFVPYYFLIIRNKKLFGRMLQD